MSLCFLFGEVARPRVLLRVFSARRWGDQGCCFACFPRGAGAREREARPQRRKRRSQGGGGAIAGAAAAAAGSRASSAGGGKNDTLVSRRTKKTPHRIHEFPSKALGAAAVESALGLELGERGSDGGRSGGGVSSGSSGSNWGVGGGERDRCSLCRRRFCLFLGGRILCCAPAVGHFFSACYCRMPCSINPLLPLQDALPEKQRFHHPWNSTDEIEKNRPKISSKRFLALCFFVIPPASAPAAECTAEGGLQKKSGRGSPRTISEKPGGKREREREREKRPEKFFEAIFLMCFVFFFFITLSSSFARSLTIRARGKEKKKNFLFLCPLPLHLYLRHVQGRTSDAGPKSTCDEKRGRTSSRFFEETELISLLNTERRACASRRSNRLSIQCSSSLFFLPLALSPPSPRAATML